MHWDWRLGGLCDDKQRSSFLARQATKLLTRFRQASYHKRLATALPPKQVCCWSREQLTAAQQHVLRFHRASRQQYE